MTRFATSADLINAVASGHEQPEHTSDWITIDQRRILAFAEATDDHQWIHLDPERAALGPFGTTIAHGFLTLSLLPRLLDGAIDVADSAMRINYGLDAVRFTNVVRVGSRIRAHSRLVAAELVPSGTKATVEIRVEIEGETRPALVARQILLIAPGEQ